MPGMVFAPEARVKQSGTLADSEQLRLLVKRKLSTFSRRVYVAFRVVGPVGNALRGVPRPWKPLRFAAPGTPRRAFPTSFAANVYSRLFAAGWNFLARRLSVW